VLRCRQMIADNQQRNRGVANQMRGHAAIGRVRTAAMAMCGKNDEVHIFLGNKPRKATANIVVAQRHGARSKPLKCDIATQAGKIFLCDPFVTVHHALAHFNIIGLQRPGFYQLGDRNRASNQKFSLCGFRHANSEGKDALSAR